MDLFGAAKKYKWYAICNSTTCFINKDSPLGHECLIAKLSRSFAFAIGCILVFLLEDERFLLPFTQNPLMKMLSVLKVLFSGHYVSLNGESSVIVFDWAKLKPFASCACRGHSFVFLRVKLCLKLFPDAGWVFMYTYSPFLPDDAMTVFLELNSFVE
jgi:hypothetical protein